MNSNTYNTMKKIALLVIIFIFINDVFGDETVSVSVNDGDSVTLHTNLTDLKRVDMIKWMFNSTRIAKINRGVSETPVYEYDERFTDRLKMNPQTGDLTITNITSELTGEYKLDFINGDIIIKTFSVSLSLVKKVIGKDSVSLHINVTEKQRKDKIHWRIKHKNSLVAEIITENKEISTPFINERFRDRVKLEDQTGDVIITNMKKEDSGEYEADVNISNTHTIHKTFRFTGPEVKEKFTDGEDEGSSKGLSPGETAGICVGVLLVIAAAAVGGVVIFRRRIKNRHQGSRNREQSGEAGVPLRNVVANNNDVP